MPVFQSLGSNVKSSQYRKARYGYTSSVDVRERHAVMVAHDEASAVVFDDPRRREVAVGRLSALSEGYGPIIDKNNSVGGTDA
jgi:hypothetical protein